MTEPLILLHSPSLESTILVPRQAVPIIKLVERLSLEDQNQLSETIIDKPFFDYQLYVVGELYREIIDINFPLWKTTRPMQPLISRETNMWKLLLKMLEKMQSLYPSIEEVAIAFDTLIQERALVFFVATSSKNGSGSTRYIRSLQSQNRKLQGCDNPFSEEKVPFTWKFVNQAILLAEQSDGFRWDYYMPLIKARQNLVAYLREERARAHLKGKLQRQGRKKEDR